MKVNVSLLLFAITALWFYARIYAETVFGFADENLFE